jgi:anti-sigma B factor antagonist
MSDTIHDDPVVDPDDSSVGKSFHDPGVLQVYQTGELTVVGFAGKDVPDEVCIAGYRDQMHKLIEDHQVKILAVDLSGVKLVPSGMLGLLTSMRKKVGRVELYNPSDDVREVLKITNLEKLFDIKEVQL